MNIETKLGPRPVVIELPHAAFRENQAQKVALALHIRQELLQIIRQIPGVTEGVLADIKKGGDIHIPLPEGKSLIVSDSVENNPAGYFSEYDEHGNDIPGPLAPVSLEKVKMSVGIRGGSGIKERIELMSRVWRHTDGRINTQDGHLNAFDEDGFDGFGLWGNDAPANKVLERVDKTEALLKGYLSSGFENF